MATNHSLVGRRLGSGAERRYMWGEAPTSVEDVYDVFDRFVRGRIPWLPWCDRIEGETLQGGLLKPLSALNHYGFLTINSQPRVNGLASDDAVFGWGPGGGHVYQKAYLEFFCSNENLNRLLGGLKNNPQISLQAYKSDGTHRAVRGGVSADLEERIINTVTWGVFGEGAVQQPTVVDSEAFEVWKDEALAMWLSAWASIYPEGSASRGLIEEIHGTFWHVYIVDNDYVNGDIYRVFAQILSLDPYAGSPVIRPQAHPK